MRKLNKIHDFYIGEDEEFFIKDIIPEHYIDQNIDNNSLDVECAVRFLQNELNAILQSFLNGGFSYLGFMFYPFIKDVSIDNLKKIKRLKRIALFLHNNGHDFSNSIKEFKGKSNNLKFARILSALYQDFFQVKHKKLNLAKKNKCKEFDVNDYKKSDLHYLRPLSGLKVYANRYLKQYLSGFYLHGSLASKDYIKGWSDVDTLSVISNETIENPEALLKLRNKMYYMRYYFYQIDQLQHHGSIVITEYDLGNYCQAYFPVPVFNYARSFFKDDKISEFSARDFSHEAFERMFYFVSYFRHLNLEKKYNLGSHDTKILLHSITLFPTIYLQAKGKLLYKKFSFDIAKKDFDRDMWQVIDDIGSMRLNWKNPGKLPLSHLSSKINPLFYYQLNSRVFDLIKDMKKTNKIDTQSLIRSMFNLSEEAWGKIKKNAKVK